MAELANGTVTSDDGVKTSAASVEQLIQGEDGKMVDMLQNDDSAALKDIMAGMGASGPVAPEKTTTTTTEETGATGVEEDESNQTTVEEDEKQATGPSGATGPIFGASGVVASASGPSGDIDLDAIQLPKHSSPKSADAFAQVKLETKRVRAEREELKAKLEELSKQVAASKELPADVKEQLEEARRIKTELLIERDPAFKAKYDDSIKSNEKEVVDLLTNGMTPEDKKQVTDYIAQQGGVQNVDLEKALAKMDGRQANYVRSLLVENVRLDREKARELAKAKENWTKYDAELQSKAEATTKAQKEAQEKWAKEFEEEAKNIEARVPWAKEQQILATDSNDVKAQKEAANKFVREAKDYFVKAATTNDAKMRANVALEAITAYKLHADLQASAKRIETLEKELNAIKAAGKTSKAQSAPVFDPKKQKPAAKATDVLSKTDEEALAEMMKEIQGNS